MVKKNEVHIGIALHPDGRKELGVSLHVKYARNKGIGSMMVIERPIVIESKLDYVVGVTLPVDKMVPNLAFGRLRKCWRILDYYTPADESTGVFIFNLLDKQTKKSAAVVDGQGNITILGLPVRHADLWGYVDAFFSEWNLVYALYQGMQEDLVAHPRQYVPVCLVLPGLPPVIVTKVTRFGGFCSECGKGGDGVRLTKCPDCSGAHFCSTPCRTKKQRHFCNNLSSVFYVDPPARELRPVSMTEIMCHVVGCHNKATTTCGPKCNFPLCGPSCKSAVTYPVEHGTFCADVWPDTDPTLLWFRYTALVQRKMQGAKKRKSKTATAQEHKSAAASDPVECYLCMGDDDGSPMQSPPCVEAHPDRVHVECWARYREHIANTSKQLRCPLCQNVEGVC